MNYVDPSGHKKTKYFDGVTYWEWHGGWVMVGSKMVDGPPDEYKGIYIPGLDSEIDNNSKAKNNINNNANYINSQEDDDIIDGNRIKDISLGFGNIADNGCGVIAAYNVLVSRSSKVKFNDVRNGIILSGGLFVGGLLGVNPQGLKNYLFFKFWLIYTAGPITLLWGIKAELSQAVIILIKWGGTMAMHYIAGISTGRGGVGGSFKFYNTYLRDEHNESIDGKEMSIWRFLDYVESNGATPVYFIGVYGKKGWW